MPSASISIAPIVATIRFHPNGKYGDPYTFVCTLVKIDHVGYIQAAMGEYNLTIRRMIEKELRACGITEVHFVRQKEQGKIAKRVK